jgi:hypothetical protein
MAAGGGAADAYEQSRIPKSLSVQRSLWSTVVPGKRREIGTVIMPLCQPSRIFQMTKRSLFNPESQWVFSGRTNMPPGFDRERQPGRALVELGKIS